MAKILNDECKRRIIRLSTDDVLNIVREYQQITESEKKYKKIREKLDEHELYLPEDLF